MWEQTSYETEMKFRPGRLLATPGAVDAFRVADEDMIHPYLSRHLNGDWGEVDEHDWAANDDALLTGERVLSAYTLKTGVRFWVITEADRSATTFLMPDEY